MNELQKEQIKLLRANGLSYGEIAKRVNATRNAVISFCHRSGSRRHSSAITASKNADQCRACGKLLVQIKGKKRRVFCSKECCIKWWHEHPEKINQRAVYSFVCAGCGKNFTAYGNSRRKYCSHECYINARFKGGGHHD